MNGSAAPLPLCRRYDVALLDLDGVVYVGSEPVPGAPEALAAVRRAGMTLSFVTNNAARPTAQVARRLSDMGVPAEPGDVISSAQAAAHYLADRLPAGAPVLVVGTAGLIEALLERGLVPVERADQAPVAVVQGFSPTMDYSLLCEGTVAVRAGLPWVATNTDRTIPSARGPMPGNGTLVEVIATATGRTPVNTGKPDPTMHRETVERSGARHPLVVGDRLDTDIQGAHAVGCASLLVLSGVATGSQLLAAAADQRPTYLGWDVGALLDEQPQTFASSDSASLRWQVSGDQHSLTLRRRHAAEHDESGGADALAALRALAAQAWDLAGEGCYAGRCRPDDDDAAAALNRLNLI